MSNTAELSFPVVLSNPETWPDVCLAEVWQPEPMPKGADRLTPEYRRRLFAAQDWETIWPVINKCSLYHYNRRPVGITRYHTTGRQLPLMLQAVELGVALPRLYALDGLLKANRLEQETPSGALPLLGKSGFWVGRKWNKIHKVWQQQNRDSLRGLGFIELHGGRIAIQPIPHDSSYTNRREWASAAAKLTGQVSDAHADFLNSPVISEAFLAARVIKPFQAHYLLNPGIVEKLHRQAQKDAMAPKAAVEGTTPNSTRPHYDWLVVLQPNPAPVRSRKTLSLSDTTHRL